MTEPEQIGLLLVHGSGEQRRFEHLDSHVPSLVSACAPAKTRRRQWKSRARRVFACAPVTHLRSDRKNGELQYLSAYLTRVVMPREGIKASSERKAFYAHVAP